MKDQRFGWYRSTPAFKDGLIDWYKAAGEPKRLLEIGVATGDSTELFATYNPDIEITVLDPWSWASPETGLTPEGTYQFFMERTKNYNITVIRDRSFTVADTFKSNQFDAVYIDADHSYDAVKQDIGLYRDKAPWIGGHDYALPRFGGCIRAVDEFAESIDRKVQTFKDTSWLIYVGD